jgi:hypothetical protein
MPSRKLESRSKAHRRLKNERVSWAFRLQSPFTLPNALYSSIETDKPE